MRFFFGSRPLCFLILSVQCDEARGLRNLLSFWRLALRWGGPLFFFPSPFLFLLPLNPEAVSFCFVLFIHLAFFFWSLSGCHRCFRSLFFPWATLYKMSVWTFFPFFLFHFQAVILLLGLFCPPCLASLGLSWIFFSLVLDCLFHWIDLVVSVLPSFSSTPRSLNRPSRSQPGTRAGTHQRPYRLFESVLTGTAPSLPEALFGTGEVFVLVVRIYSHVLLTRSHFGPTSHLDPGLYSFDCYGFWVS